MPEGIGHTFIMNKYMKQLMKHLSDGNYTTEDSCVIFKAIMEYGTARVEFIKSSTPESEALARWRMSDARSAWCKVVREYGLPVVEVDCYF